MFPAAESAFIITAQETLLGPNPSLFLVVATATANSDSATGVDILRDVSPQLVLLLQVTLS